MIIETVRGTQRADATRVHVQQHTVALGAVSQKLIATKAVCRRGVKDVCVTVKLIVRTAVARRVRDEVDDTAVHVGTVLRTVWTTKDLDSFQTRRLDQAEERSHTAALRTGRVTHAIDVDGNVSAGESTHKHRAQRRTGALQIHAWLFIDHLRHHFRRTFEDLALVDEVHLRVDLARVGDESGFRSDGDLFGDRRKLEHNGEIDRASLGDVNGRAMSHETSALDSELIVAGREPFKSEATLCVGRRSSNHVAVGIQQRNAGAADNRAVRILHGTVDASVRFLRESNEWHRAREQPAPQCSNDYFHKSFREFRTYELYRRNIITTSHRK